jgi:hypothetical protein
MSQPAGASDPFVPFDPIQLSTPKPSETPAHLKVVSRAEVDAGFNPLSMDGAPSLQATHGGAGKPGVVLQREGDRVTGIRIECTCGQVIELACSY